ncbi:uncharacterized MFS-type transporter C09D4.1 [Tribolium castaneum]|uniref:Choline/ethanolamine transporter FLVCR1 n=1 Tax=Tribolium castaneum TaxID=7070 RepID=D6WNC0_TRICA|nr:PREDICTED: uncharacterized MFS-type transporter C09D4.1 [Tribolium castaneum]XP_008194298.1 PREDICTED: uncharacterized MFS-type transporter C09D4.1 [Tribolium castaneum]EFA03239.1 putative MFS-type transporter C09D4.1-like Protein [Tribolium castaneum]|eukprot:XP_001812950.1 PREDICTED: uncharacterized MFS-type transporter C09D4.1 [Tribolium castaneum]
MQPDPEKHGALPEIEKLKVYPIRWFILAIFVLYSTSNALQWIQYSIIADVIVNYYGVSTTWVDWTSMLYMILYIPFIFPGSYLLDKLGLRVAIIIGMVGTCAGAWIKVASVAPDRFWVGFLGQGIVALSQVFVLSVPARLAAVWFGPTQVSLACSIGVFGNQLGIALGFLIPPMIVSGGTQEQITHDLYVLFIAVGIYTSVLLILILIFFKSEPPTPPSYAQAQELKNEENVNFVQSLRSLVSNRSYMLLLVSYGINTGIFYAISTLLNQIILLYYPNNGEDAGRIGLVIVVAGMVGSVVCGFVLDWSHKFKETTLAVYALSLVGMVVYTFTLNEGIGVVYFTSALLGFFMTGLLPVGFEFGAELTYPEPEGTSAGLLNASCQVFGIAFTSIYSVIFNNLNDIWANSIMSVMLLIGTIMTALIKSDLRRQAAQNK